MPLDEILYRLCRDIGMCRGNVVRIAGQNQQFGMGDLELGVRPEHIIVAPEAAHDVTVEMTEPMGSDLLAWTRLGDRPLSIRLPAETKLATGDRPPTGPVPRPQTEPVRCCHGLATLERDRLGLTQPQT